MIHQPRYLRVRRHRQSGGTDHRGTDEIIKRRNKEIQDCNYNLSFRVVVHGINGEVAGRHNRWWLVVTVVNCGGNPKVRRKKKGMK
ncbi:hypothetical protein E3N88_43749 [Mikania micrantha]|uniref:Uncharacterized protein n=1 Tax=Mikania micrantha TaxID=192012 RepID=A0A5N6LE19_9ASTR|nr:hypothetical protein E3N88_43749 [Mikania micrantha]